MLYILLLLLCIIAGFLPEACLALRRWLGRRIPTKTDPTYFVKGNVTQDYQRPLAAEELGWWRRTWHYSETLKEIYKASEKLSKLTFEQTADAIPAYPEGIAGCLLFFIPFFLFFAPVLRLLLLPFVVLMLPFFLLEFVLNGMRSKRIK